MSFGEVGYDHDGYPHENDLSGQSIRRIGAWEPEDEPVMDHEVTPEGRIYTSMGGSWMQAHGPGGMSYYESEQDRWDRIAKRAAQSQFGMTSGQAEYLQRAAGNPKRRRLFGWFRR